MRKLLLLAGLLAPAVGWGLPNEFVQEGIVYDGGQVVGGAHDITIRLYANEVGGNPLFEEVHPAVDFFDGYYSVSIGSIEDLSESLFLRPSLYLGISIDDGRELEPRTPIVKVPAAFVANVAANVTGDITPRTISIGGDLVVNENGQWVGDPAGLRGPPGPPGEGADVDAVIQAIINALEEDPDLLPFLHKLEDDAVVNSTTRFEGSRLVFDFGAPANALDMGNNNIVNVNRILFQDPGFDEGIRWGGTQARIVVAGPAGENRDGPIRIINEDDGIRLEGPTNIIGDLSISGAITAVQQITATVVNATTANITNANVTNLNGPGNRINVIGELNLSGDVRIGANTDFIGIIRSGGLVSGGDIQGRNISATASISAAGNITAGGRLTAGNGGIWVGNIQVFDGNGNLVRRPVYQCPNGQVMQGTDNNGIARCVPLSCPVGQYLRGLDGNNRPICEADAGLRVLPENACPPGQAIVRIASNGATTCGKPRAEPQACDEGQFVTGLDNDGSVICEDAPEGGGGGDGVCAPGEVRPNILVCGNSSRNVNTFIPPGYNFNVQAGCNPNNQTQVMFVTRSGGGNAPGNAAAWQAYLRAGGNIVTEYNITHTVYNAIFGTNVGRGTRRGSCRDNAMTVVKMNVNDPFWARFDIAPIAAGDQACGYEVGHFPELVALGGWTANQVNFGYRDLGEGRLWVLDADWQDNENYWRAQSTQLMNALIVWGCGDGGGDAGDALVFNGVRRNVPNAEVVGWQECHRSTYGQSGLPLANILQNCNGTHIMYGCRQVGAGAWRVMGQGERASVFRDTGNGNNTTQHNGIGWYFSGGASIGFAPAGQAVTRNSCDTTNMGNDDRICWHTSGNNMNGGWRCGSATSLNNNNSYERVIWSRNGGAAPPPPPANLFQFQGVRQDVPDNQLAGWERCYRSTYGASGDNINNMMAACSRSKIMYGCREIGQANWRVLAQGDRASVFRNTGDNNNTTTQNNGVGWYFSQSYSIGFAPGGQAVTRSSCDTTNRGNNDRICWHTGGGSFNGGWRCGSNTSLNGNNSWERVIWHGN